MDSDDLVPFSIVLWWVNVVDVWVRNGPVSLGRSVVPLFEVAMTTTLSIDLSSLNSGLYLGKDLVARRVSSQKIASPRPVAISGLFAH